MRANVSVELLAGNGGAMIMIDLPRNVSSAANASTIAIVPRPESSPSVSFRTPLKLSRPCSCTTDFADRPSFSYGSVMGRGYEIKRYLTFHDFLPKISH